MRIIILLIFITISLHSLAPPRIGFNINYIKKEMSHVDKLILAISIHESGNNENAYNNEEDAVGILQIRKIYVDEANRLSGKKFQYVDRFDKEKSIEMFKIIMDKNCNSYNIDSVCVIHNAGGFSSRDFEITKGYRDSIKRIYLNI